MSAGQPGLDPQSGEEMSELPAHTEPNLPTHQHNYTQAN